MQDKHRNELLKRGILDSGSSQVVHEEAGTEEKLEQPAISKNASKQTRAARKKERANQNEVER